MSLKNPLAKPILALLALYALAALTNAYAAGWSDRPSWQQNSKPSAADGERRRTTSGQNVRERERESNLAPFSPGSHNLALDVGQVFLMGDLGGRYNDSIGWGAHYTYGASDMFGFDSSLNYSSHSDGQFSMTTLLSGVRMNLAWYDKIIPHLDFGLGFYRPSYQYSQTASLSPVIFGLHIGPGVDLELTKEFFFGANLTFHDMFGSSRTLANGQIIDVGGSFTSFNLRAGMTF
jgi:hypothetical protein